jgi:hypothetical protein
MFIRPRDVEFEATYRGLLPIQLLRSYTRLRFLVGRQRRVIPIRAHTALQHAPGLADLSLLFGIAVVVETEVKGHDYR